MRPHFVLPRRHLNGRKQITGDFLGRSETFQKHQFIDLQVPDGRITSLLTTKDANDLVHLFLLDL